MSSKIVIFAIMVVLVIIVIGLLVLLLTGKLKTPKKSGNIIADDIRKRKYDTEEYKGEINTKSLTELLDGEDWRAAKPETGDLKTDIVSEDLITEGNKKLEKALLRSEALNREKKPETSEELGTGIFTVEERTGLLDQIIDEEASVENDYKTSILIPEEDEAPKDPQHEITAEEEEIPVTVKEPEKEEAPPKEEEELSKEEKESSEKEQEEEEGSYEQKTIDERKLVSENVEKLNFDGETFSESFMREASVSSSTFRDVKFENSIFSKVLFKAVSFKFSEFKGTYIIGCTFKNCDFTKTDFGDTVFDNVKFINCIFDEKTDTSNVSVKKASFVSGNEKTDVKGTGEFTEAIEKLLRSEA